ncbi:hypothetical protein FRX31_010445 [Thalictrum thalictroides]|uniref:Uncharacterized protein n=1 Tax=Thalictrum thalictroides TaxID=46969 RepID=A0A7J6WT37_THATH|nr:hypothetical protein FRX31_010445 [Thalictrum thalictroides]
MKMKWFQGESSRNQENNNLQKKKLSVNEEYLEAFRTKSYIEICSKVQAGQVKTIEERVPSLPSKSLRTYSHLSENLLEPRQEILVELIRTSGLHHLLVDYFEGSLEAFRICAYLLQIIDQMRANHGVIEKVIKLSKRVSNLGEFSEDQCKVIYNELASFVKLDNPIPLGNSNNRLNFNLVQDRYRLMLLELTTKYRQVKKRAKVIRIFKRASGISLIIACGTISIVTLVLALHSLVGIVAAPALVTVPFIFLKKKIKSAQRQAKACSLSSFGAQLDAAAKGVFILKRDFDTLSRLLMWLHDEIEYRKSRAGLCVKYQEKWRLKEVVKEFQSHESSFMEKIEELEDHVYLCFLNINRFRRLVIQEAVVHRLK